MLLVLVGPPDALGPVDLLPEVLASPQNRTSNGSYDYQENQEFHTVLLFVESNPIGRRRSPARTLCYSSHR